MKDEDGEEHKSNEADNTDSDEDDDQLDEAVSIQKILINLVRFECNNGFVECSI